MSNLKDTLQLFTQGNLHDAGLALFTHLGVGLKTSTARPVALSSVIKSFPQTNRSIFEAAKETYFLGVVDDNIFGLFQPENEGFEKAVSRVDKSYKGIFLFAVQLAGDAKPTRTELAALTRAFNRESKHIPVIVLVKYQMAGRPLLSFAASERSAYAQEWRSGEKVGKISLLKDIDLAQPHRGHLEILEALRLKSNVQDFNGLHKQWQEVFDIQTLNKRFYRELFTWFCWAKKNIRFPDMVGVEDEKVLEKLRSIHAIRLITRLLFTWFLKEKGLAPDVLFDKKGLAKFLHFGKDDDTVYYKAILQNLFFATLNQEMNEPGKTPNRYFAKDEGFHKNKNEHGIKNLYRYAKLFQNGESEALKLFEKTPFLNGGLFDCLDKSADESASGKAEYVDGFSRNTKRHPLVPDKLFFGSDILDLTDEYGDKKHSKEQADGILVIFNRYKFTVEENTPLDQEVALDPELLGRVFENLLASYNPETGASARKATGSYYTPREIVDYMVNESLVQYLLEKAAAHFAKPAMPQNLFGEATRSQLNIADKHDWPESERTKFEEQLRRLLAGPDAQNPFDDATTRMLIAALNNCRLLDPACGSGAFPMGALQRMVQLLGRLDPGNVLWKQEQRERVIGQQVEALKNDRTLLQGLSDAQIREQATQNVEQKLVDIENSFNPSKSELDFARKLYLIENCLFGVDIQPIAVQIAKLRCFISLIIEQKVNDGEPNRGILPLPNLETKFVAADTLIALEKENFDLFQNNLQDLKAKLRALRHDYFTVRNRRDKSRLQKEDERIRKDIQKVLDDAIEEYCRGIEAKIEELNARTDLQKAEIKKIKAKGSLNAADNANLLRMEKGIRQASSEISKLETLLLRREAYHRTAEQLAAWNPYDLNAAASWFDPEWMFDVREGFDVVIGNPPYFQIQKMKNDYKDVLSKQQLSTYSKSSDIYCLFYEKGVQVLQKSGILSFITSNSWMKTLYGEALRAFFVRETSPLFLINFEDSQLFQAAIVETNILVAKKGMHPAPTWGAVIGSDADADVPLPDLVEKVKTELKGLSEKEWIISSGEGASLKLQIEEGKKQLGQMNVSINFGIKTGYNEAFIIDEATKNELIEKDPKVENILKPLLRGRDVQKYKPQFADYWLIHTFNGFLFNAKQQQEFVYEVNGVKYIEKDGVEMKVEREEERGRNQVRYNRVVVSEDYPALLEYFTNPSLEAAVKKRQDKGDHWTNLRNCDYVMAFEQPKILWGELADAPKFSFDDQNYYPEATLFLMTGESLKYLLSILNSKLGEWYFNQISSTSGMGTNRWKKYKIEQLPIATATPEEEKAVETVVDYVLWLKQHQPTDHETQSAFFEQLLDGMVYELYFKKSVHDAGREVIAHLGELPSLSGGAGDEGSTIRQVYERLSHPEHKVRNNLLFMKSIEEIRIIEGL